MRIHLAIAIMVSITVAFCFAAYWLAGGFVAPDYEHPYEHPDFVGDDE